MAVSNRIKTIAGTLIAVAIVYLAVLNLVDRVNWEQLDEGIDWVQREDSLLVGSVQDLPRRLGIAPGDILLDINGMRVTNLNEYTRLLESFSEPTRGEVIADYTFRKSDGGEITVPLVLTAESGLQAGDPWLIASAFVFLGIGLFIFLRNGQARGAFHFYLICLIAFCL
ncbi:MAG TPA: hypothetical protein VKZ59_11595, partial [Acidobacteriota bacterium]|nr:hypothetical protein [Acidobacteriota bacterium]